MEERLHVPEEFLGKFGSKLDLYQLLTVDSGYFRLTFYSELLLADIKKNIIGFFKANSCWKEKGMKRLN